MLTSYTLHCSQCRNVKIRDGASRDEKDKKHTTDIMEK